MTHPPEPIPSEPGAAEEVKTPTAPLPEISDAFPEAREAARQLADEQPEEAAEGTEPAEPEAPAPTAAPPRPRRTGEGLRGSDEFVRARATARLPFLASDLPTTAEGDPEAEERAAAALERRWEALIAQVEDAARIAGTVLDPLESRIGAVRIGLDLAARSPADREQRIAQLPPEIHNLLRGLVGRVHDDAYVARRLQIALFQFGDARRAVGALQERLARAAELPRADGIAFLSKLEVPKVKGKLYVVANFPNVFRGDPVLGRLFPPRGATAPTPPPQVEPAPAPPRAETGPKAGTANLREAWEAVRTALGKRKPG